MEGSHTYEAAGRLRIAVSGKSGCGNTTVCTLLSRMLGVRLINFTFRNLSSELGISLQELLKLAKTDSRYDRSIDSRQLELAREGDCVLGSRLAIWLFSEADFKVYLDADEYIRARRVYEREGGDFDDVLAFTRLRDREDSERYRLLYGIDNTDISAADLCIDTGRCTACEVAEQILAALINRALIKRR